MLKRRLTRGNWLVDQNKELTFPGFHSEHINSFVQFIGRLSQGQPDPHQSKKFMFMFPLPSLRAPSAELGSNKAAVPLNIECSWQVHKLNRPMKTVASVTRVRCPRRTFRSATPKGILARMKLSQRFSEKQRCGNAVHPPLFTVR